MQRRVGAPRVIERQVVDVASCTVVI